MSPTLPQLAMAAAIVASLLIWSAIGVRGGQTVVRCEPRRRVPWGGGEALVMLGLYFCGMIAAQPLVVHVLKITPGNAPGDPDANHPVLRLLRDSPSLGTRLLCLLSVVIVAPLVEEFFFRVALQGWLEKEEGQQRREQPVLRHLPRGLLPVLVVALLFSAMHGRTSTQQVDPRYLQAMLLLGGVLNLVTMALGMFVLQVTSRATWSDLGFSARRTWADMGRGLFAFLAVAAPAYVIQFTAKLCFGDRFSPDPAGLFLFAVAMGWLYFRTHRVVPSIALHALLNGSSLALILAG